MTSTHKLRITVLRRLGPSDIFDQMPVSRREWMIPCSLYKDGQEFLLKGPSIPEGFCPSAWRAIYHNVRTLGYGGELPFHDEGNVAVNCCTDGLRPVVFKIERL
jgi:uncharacterized repeat protein (TIGR04076 family)